MLTAACGAMPNIDFLLIPSSGAGQMCRKFGEIEDYCVNGRWKL